jgi:Putative Ig domain
VPDQTARPNVAFSFVLPANTFGEADAPEVLSLAAGPLPVWLTFNPSNATFSGTPGNSDLGTFAITVTLTDDDDQAAFAAFRIFVSGSAPLAPPTPTALSLWRELSFGAHVLDPSQEAKVWGNDADPDYDGLSNLQEYLYGSNPMDPADHGQGLAISTDATGQILVSYNRRTNDPRITYFLETSQDMLSWSVVDPLAQPESTQILSSGIERVTTALSTPNPEAGFFRVRIVYAP